MGHFYFIFLCNRRILQSDLQNYKLKQNLETKKMTFSTINQKYHNLRMYSVFAKTLICTRTTYQIVGL